MYNKSETAFAVIGDVLAKNNVRFMLGTAPFLSGNPWTTTIHGGTDGLTLFGASPNGSNLNVSLVLRPTPEQLALAHQIAREIIDALRATFAPVSKGEAAAVLVWMVDTPAAESVGHVLSDEGVTP